VDSSNRLWESGNFGEAKGDITRKLHIRTNVIQNVITKYLNTGCLKNTTDLVGCFKNEDNNNKQEGKISTRKY
jgi:hypothetical protein